jgi:NAD(P)-dependent dehydrogenase (short-subunit alcohol dehydrogenase family)
MRFENKVAVVTGGATGIGEAVSKKLAGEGARIVVVGLKDDPVDEVVKEIEADYQAEAMGVTGDLSDKQVARDVIDKTIERFGKIDVLIANASIHPEWNPLVDFSDENFENMLNANIKGTFYIVKAAIPKLRETRGCIVASGSIAGINGLPEASIYAASKAWISNLMKSLAVEEGPNGIRANTVSPGPILTQMTESSAGAISDESEDMIKSTTVFGRRGTTEEAANVYAFLASDEASYVTGSEYRVDGGILLTNGPEGEKALDEVKRLPEGKLKLRHEVVPEETYR